MGKNWMEGFPEWPMIIYEAARIAMLLHIFAVTINRNALHEVPCTQLTFMSKRELESVVDCQIVAWSQTFRFSKAKWNETRKLCDVLSTGPRSLMVSVWAYTMVFDLVILVLCSYRLASHRSSTLGNLLLRDGISYFCFAFSANLIQTVMAGLQLNPVMNIMTLPFAVVVPVIVATTVFRNVFTESDNFYSDTSGPTDPTHPTSGGEGPFIRTGAHILFNHNTSTHPVLSTNEIPLGEYKSTHDIGFLHGKTKKAGSSVKLIYLYISLFRWPIEWVTHSLLFQVIVRTTWESAFSLPLALTFSHFSHSFALVSTPISFRPHLSRKDYMSEESGTSTKERDVMASSPRSTLHSASNSSSSPPEPETPLRTNRSRTRYPDLGRVPLHRRGTSKTYETLEDLLKEAGYKETRIFTPETERLDSKAARGPQDDKRLSVKDGMGAVVGFFAGLMPSATGSKPESSEDSLTTSPLEFSPPTSPLTQRYNLQRSATRSSFESSAPSTSNITSSIESLKRQASPHQHSSRSNSPAPTIMHYQQQPPLIIRSASHVHQLQTQPSRSSIRQQSNNNIVSPRPSRAGAYLRHMTSIQTMPQRPSSTPVDILSRPRIQLNDSNLEASGSSYRRRGNGEGEGDDEPPLPPTWLETVARAVLFGGNGAYVGGPANVAVPEQPRHASGSAMPKPPRIQVLRPTRSSLSQVSSRRVRQRATPRSGLSDQTNASDLLAPPQPPALFSKLERGRAERSEGEVTKTRVMCRSAPGSRSGSITRGATHDRKERLKERGRDRRKRGEKDRVPSLARTQTEGDVWSRSRASIAPPTVAHRYYSGWGADVESDGAENEDPTISSSEEEGELDLARILVPPKRQNSIKSLRKHLANENTHAQATLKNIAAMIPGAARGVNVVSGGTPSVVQRRTAAKQGEELDWDAQEWGGGWVRKGRGAHGSEDDDIESFTGFIGADRSRFGSTRSGSGKARLGFNSSWGLTGS
ncbi:hypothetical protein BDN70DRAFT_889562 [Pholiota conissans]|uniref:Uncharacterized protein n=1 Tax=Pholiota conissans TaxID=109636 RepID=A0A9P5ZHX9_9AGAR|nr:hypothetical protein BDN70DRAFT_889562 [Pholiota conissans]